MKIKFLIFAFVLISSATFAQRGELASAKSSYDKYVDFKQFNARGLGAADLQNAKKSIDKVVVHEKTVNDASAWAYKALIYTDLAALDSTATDIEPLINEASEAITKAKDLDRNGTNKTPIDRASTLLSQFLLNRGVTSYQAAKYNDAYLAFKKALIYKPGDTTVTYYTGLAAINSKNYKAAIEQYEQLIATNYSANQRIYLDLSRMYSMEKDTTAAIRIASTGASKYPNDVALATQEIELSLISGKHKEVIAKIIDQAQKNPTNKLYPFYLGIAYNGVNDADKAEEAYKKAIAIDPNYADAYTNLGAVLLNKGINTYNTANKLPQNKQKEYDVMIKKANEQFEVALPYLLKAVDLNPSSRVALESLKKYYIIKKDKVKMDEVNEKLKRLK